MFKPYAFVELLSLSVKGNRCFSIRLMIHDIDIILSLVDSKITKISANGTKIISTSPDIAQELNLKMVV